MINKIKTYQYFNGIVDVIGVIGITIFAVLIYRPILFPLNPNQIPWGSDTLGHIFRFEYLLQSIQQGVSTPTSIPEWYLGIELFRYYPPLIYYVLSFFSYLSKDPVVSANFFIFCAAWFGAVSWILYRKWLGIGPAFIGGLLYTILPDPIRVSMAEGNLQRAFTTALIPVLVYYLLTSLESRAPRKKLISIAVIFHILVLGHPMMAAIIATISGFLVLLAGLFKIAKIKNVFLSILFIGLGIISASWWLLPSLTGGITELSKESVIQGLPVVSLRSLIDPATRANNPEALYIGITLFFIPLLALILPSKNRRYLAMIVIPGLISVLFVTPILNTIFNAFPLSGLMWPARYLSPASFLLLLASLLFVSRQRIWIQIPVLLVLFFDAGASTHLIDLRPPNQDLETVLYQMAETPGWREATLDFSRMGSEITYQISAQTNRDQIFGWAFQGARSASTVSSINEALGNNAIPYVIDRLNLLGVDDVIIPNQFPSIYGFNEALEEQGFQFVDGPDSISYYHRDGQPRAIVSDWSIIAIGYGAQNYAYIFPQIIVGGTPYLDEYSLEELSRFDVIVLSGFQWHNQNRAEDLVRRLSSFGNTVIIDLTHTQPQVIAQTPRFLGVWGENIILDRISYSVEGRDIQYTLAPFEDNGSLWYTHTPQGLENVSLTLDFYGQEAVLTGYNQYGEGKVWFVGFNLAYHVLQNQDQQAEEILSEIINLQANQLSNYQTIALESYIANSERIQFEYTLEEDERILIPVSRFEGTSVEIDGNPAALISLSTFIAFNAPSGTHNVTIEIQPTSIFKLGGVVTIFIVVLSGYIYRRLEKEYK